MERLAFALPIVLRSTGEPLTRDTIIVEQRRVADKRAFVNALEKGPIVDKDATEATITELAGYRGPGMSSRHARSLRDSVYIFARNFYAGNITEQAAVSTALQSMRKGILGPRTR
ncbi:MAG: hypothetical protein ACRDFB_05930 [Rhabdochlamydiaceae bacterium]